MKSRDIIPQIRSIEDAKSRTIELIPKENYEDLEQLTQKSIEFYKFFNSRYQNSHSEERTERRARLDNSKERSHDI